MITIPPHQWLRGLCLLVFVCLNSLRAEPGALIVVGLSGDNQISAQYQDLAQRTASALQVRGLPADRITTLTERVTRQDILDAISAQLQGVTADEEYWIFLMGHGGLGRDDAVQFQVRGPRLEATDLQEALIKAEPAAPIVILGFDRSGGFLPHLDDLQATTITATSGVQERSLPRFTGIFVEELEDAPDNDVTVLAARAAERTKTFYESQSLARSEESRLFDPKTGSILQPPFGVEDLHQDRPVAVAAKDPFAGVLASEINIPKPKGDDLFTEMPATDETRALIAEAQAALNPEGFSGLILRRDVELTVAPTLNSSQRERLRVYLINAESFNEWANYEFPINPPSLMSRIEAARLILPDGRSLVLGNADTTSKDPDLPPMSHLFFPRVEEGSIIELEYVTESTARQDIPAYYDELYLQSSLPTLAFDLSLNLPKDEKFHYYLANLDAEPTATADDLSRTYVWQLTNVPAYQPLPYDPPARQWVQWLGVSSLATWEDFTTWFSRISEGAFDANEEVVALAQEIEANYPTCEERIQAAYEYVSSMRYIAIEIGIQAFRPRTPGKVLHQNYGDCKDKANLLSALLREMDIPAHIALINRFSFTDTEFPGWQFNHAIAYVEPSPEHPNGLWLDATETTTQYGELAPGNAGRNALVVTKAGEGNFHVAQPHDLIEKPEQWRITTEGDAYQGEYTRTIDNALQQRLSSKSPLQLQFTLLALVEPLLGPLSNLQSATKAGDESIIAKAQIDGALPTPSIPWDDAFIAPTRDRPLQLVEAPTRYSQNIILPANTLAELPPKFSIEHDAFSCQVRWLRSADGENLSRVATFEIRQPVIPAEAYPAVRQAYREWRAALDYDLPPTE